MSNDDPKYMQIRGQTHKRLRPIHWRPSLQSCKERPGIHRTNLQSFKESFHSLVTEEFLKVGEGDLAMSPFVYPELKQKSPNTSIINANHFKKCLPGCSSFSVSGSSKKFSLQFYAELIESVFFCIIFWLLPPQHLTPLAYHPPASQGPFMNAKPLVEKKGNLISQFLPCLHQRLNDHLMITLCGFDGGIAENSSRDRRSV